MALVLGPGGGVGDEVRNWEVSDAWVVNAVAHFRGIERYRGWRQEVVMNATQPHVHPNPNPAYPGSKQCPPGTVVNAIHLSFASVPSCQQVCVFPAYVDDFQLRGGAVGFTCREAGCDVFVGEAWASNIQYFKYACKGGTPALDHCLRDLETKQCVEELDLINLWLHARMPELIPWADFDHYASTHHNLDVRITGEGMAWHRTLALSIAVVALVLSLGAGLIVLRIVDNRPELLKANEHVRATTPGGGALKRIDLFRGMKVAEIRDSLQGSSSKTVVTKEGAVFEWAPLPGKSGTSTPTPRSLPATPHSSHPQGMASAAAFPVTASVTAQPGGAGGSRPRTPLGPGSAAASRQY